MTPHQWFGAILLCWLIYTTIVAFREKTHQPPSAFELLALAFMDLNRAFRELAEVIGDSLLPRMKGE